MQWMNYCIEKNEPPSWTSSTWSICILYLPSLLFFFRMQTFTRKQSWIVPSSLPKNIPGQNSIDLKAKPLDSLIKELLQWWKNQIRFIVHESWSIWITKITTFKRVVQPLKVNPPPEGWIPLRKQCHLSTSETITDVTVSHPPPAHACDLCCRLLGCGGVMWCNVLPAVPQWLKHSTTQVFD